MEQVREAVRVAADILETLGPNADGAVLARIERLDRSGDHEAGFWRLVARAMRRLGPCVAADHRAGAAAPRASWAMMQQVERLFRQAEQLEAQAQTSAEPLQSRLLATAGRWRSLAEALSRDE